MQVDDLEVGPNMVRFYRERIAKLEAALDEIRGASFEMSRAANGTVQTMCVPIGAWDNAMRSIRGNG